MAAQVDKLKQSDSHKIKADRRICAIFLPQLSIDSPSTLISTLHLLKPLAKEIFVITGNLSRDVISGDSIHLINIKHSDRPQSIFIRIPRFIILQFKISYALIKIASNINIVVLAAGASALFLPALLAKLLRKRVILLRHGTDSFQKSNKTDYQNVLFGRGNHIFPSIIDTLIGLNCILADRLAVFSSSLTDPRLKRYTKKIYYGSRFYVDVDSFKVEKGLDSRENLVGYIGRFDTDKVTVDTSVYNPARIWKLYGTTTRKGDAVPTGPNREARPHRMAYIDGIGE